MNYYISNIISKSIYLNLNKEYHSQKKYFKQFKPIIIQLIYYHNTLFKFFIKNFYKNSYYFPS